MSKQACDHKQAAVESSFCQWRLESISSCSIYASCREMALQQYNQTLANAKANAASRKLEWTSVQSIKCYIDVLLSDATVSQREADMDICEGAQYDTAHLHIAPSTLASAKPCGQADDQVAART